MRLLLTSFDHPAVPQFVQGRIAYIGDAARSYGDAPFVHVERDALRGHGLTLVDLPVADTPVEEIGRILDAVDGVYVAGGETFDLLQVLRDTGADEILVDAVRGGLPYIGCSAGSIVAGPTVEPASLIDDPGIAPGLTDYRGLGLTEYVVIPHAAGNLPPFPIDLYADTVRKYGELHRLVLLRDGEALLVDGDGTHLI